MTEIKWSPACQGTNMDTMSCLQGGGKIRCFQQAVYSSVWHQRTWGGSSKLFPQVDSERAQGVFLMCFSGKSGWLCQADKSRSHNQNWLGLWCYSFSPGNGGGGEHSQEAGLVLKPCIALCLNDLKRVCSERLVSVEISIVLVWYKCWFRGFSNFSRWKLEWKYVVMWKRSNLNKHPQQFC